jgi:hypothetical protein
MNSKEEAQMDENRIDTIFQRILKAIEPDQSHDGFDSIILALQKAITFQMALACPHCRKGIGRKLRADIPAMLTAAGQLARSAQQEFGEHHTTH